MFLSRRNAATLVQMARQETDPALRKRIVERLSTMKEKEAVDYMMEILKKCLWRKGGTTIKHILVFQPRLSRLKAKAIN